MEHAAWKAAVPGFFNLEIRVDTVLTDLLAICSLEHPLVKATPGPFATAVRVSSFQFSVGGSTDSQSNGGRLGL